VTRLRDRLDHWRFLLELLPESDIVSSVLNPPESFGRSPPIVSQQTAPQLTAIGQKLQAEEVKQLIWGGVGACSAAAGVTAPTSSWIGKPQSEMSTWVPSLSHLPAEQSTPNSFKVLAVARAGGPAPGS
jgi:hypothetical protein